MAGFTQRKTINDDYRMADSYYANLIKLAPVNKNTKYSTKVFKTPPFYAKFIPGYKNPYEIKVNN